MRRFDDLDNEELEDDELFFIKRKNQKDPRRPGKFIKGFLVKKGKQKGESSGNYHQKVRMRTLSLITYTWWQIPTVKQWCVVDQEANRKVVSRQWMCSRHMTIRWSMFLSLKPKDGGTVTYGDDFKGKIAGKNLSSIMCSVMCVCVWLVLESNICSFSFFSCCSEISPVQHTIAMKIVEMCMGGNGLN